MTSKINQQKKMPHVFTSYSVARWNIKSSVLHVAMHIHHAPCSLLLSKLLMTFFFTLVLVQYIFTF